MAVEMTVGMCAVCERRVGHDLGERRVTVTRKCDSVLKGENGEI